ncbi:ubiquitin carboxyl-terminal hydrolase [Cardiosporidium cionae]|uniref:Ubiquitin carboxyl-terminal hydrolase n=1 Tax=Cardiosporidium cionae TaxID=476202 RepID=A0ABQ7JAE4_9APIC|nr:ubiquitin carboxyl-terminal hydrolase [Cardiosporidium cionae]|eukprot:KAF8820956.1 ubiquitin carboxyl-terminal hydrolase [Cardiosporidium cionae]
MAELRDRSDDPAYSPPPFPTVHGGQFPEQIISYPSTQLPRFPSVTYAHPLVLEEKPNDNSRTLEASFPELPTRVEIPLHFSEPIPAVNILSPKREPSNPFPEQQGSGKTVPHQIPSEFSINADTLSSPLLEPLELPVENIPSNSLETDVSSFGIYGAGTGEILGDFGGFSDSGLGGFSSAPMEFYVPVSNQKNLRGHSGASDLRHSSANSHASYRIDPPIAGNVEKQVTSPIAVFPGEPDAISSRHLSQDSLQALNFQREDPFAEETAGKEENWAYPALHPTEGITAKSSIPSHGNYPIKGMPSTSFSPPLLASRNRSRSISEAENMGMLPSLIENPSCPADRTPRCSLFLCLVILSESDPFLNTMETSPEFPENAYASEIRKTRRRPVKMARPPATSIVDSSDPSQQASGDAYFNQQTADPAFHGDSHPEMAFPYTVSNFPAETSAQFQTYNTYPEMPLEATYDDPNAFQESSSMFFANRVEAMYPYDEGQGTFSSNAMETHPQAGTYTNTSSMMHPGMQPFIKPVPISEEKFAENEVYDTEVKSNYQDSRAHDRVSLLKKVLLSMNASEDEQCHQISQIVQISNLDTLKRSAEETIQFLNWNPYKQFVCIYTLKMIMACQPEMFIDFFTASYTSKLFHPEGNDDIAGDFLRTYLTFKEKYHQASQTKDASFHETEELIQLCKLRGNVTDENELRASRLRDWVCSIWSHVNSSKPPPNRLCTLLLSWIENPYDSIELKETAFMMLLHERQTGYIRELILLESFFEKINAVKEFSSPHLQHAIFFLDSRTLPALFNHLFTKFQFTREIFLSQWIALILQLSQRDFIPPFLTTHARKFDSSGFCSYFFLSALLEAARHSFFSKSSTQGMEIAENCVRVCTAVAASPLNAFDSLSLLGYLVFEGPFPLKNLREGHTLFASLSPFLEKYKYLWEVSGTLYVELNRLLQALLEFFNSLASQIKQQQVLEILNQPSPHSYVPTPAGRFPPTQMRLTKDSAPLPAVSASLWNNPPRDPAGFSYTMQTSSPPISNFVSRPPDFANGYSAATPPGYMTHANARMMQNPLHLSYSPSAEAFQSISQFQGMPQVLDGRSFYATERSPFSLTMETPSFTEYIGSVPPSLLPSKGRKRVGTLLVGLDNLGNSCFMNGCIQALFMTDAFVKRCLEFNPKMYSSSNKTTTLNVKVVSELKRLFARMLSTKMDSIGPLGLYHALPEEFKSGKQQDASEFMRILYDELGGHEGDFLRDIFAGITIQKVLCRRCGKVTERKDCIHDFSFNIPSAETVKEQVSKGKSSPSIQRYFDAFGQQEELTGENKYFCNRCQRKCVARVWNEIFSPPTHVMVALSRYAWSIDRKSHHKIATFVNIEEKIQVWEMEYFLYAVILHGGQSAESGHYYCIGRKSEGALSKWYEINDSIVSQSSYKRINEIAKESTSDDTPYMAFYRCSKAPATSALRLTSANLRNLAE